MKYKRKWARLRARQAAWDRDINGAVTNPTTRQSLTQRPGSLKK